MNVVIVILVVVGALFAVVAIGDLFDRVFRKRTGEQVHRRWRPLSHTDPPAIDVDGGGFVDDTYGGGTWSDPLYPNGVRDGWYDPVLGDRDRHYDADHGDDRDRRGD